MVAFVLALGADGVFRVDHLEVNPHDVFADSAGFPYSVVNFFHLTTKPWVIRELLTFKEGDLVSLGILEENERRLRSLGIFGEVQVVPLKEDTDNIVWVGTWDNWTTSLYIDLARAGGGQRFGLGLVEHNFLGFAKSFSARFQKDYERRFWEFKYFDPNLWGSELTLLWQDRSDGYRAEASLERPFKVVWDRYSWGVSAWADSATLRAYYHGEPVDSEAVGVKGASVKLLANRGFDKVVAWGVEGVWWDRAGEEHLRRWGAGPSFLYEERKFVKTKFLDGFGYTEDFSVGLSLGGSAYLYEGGFGGCFGASKGWSRADKLFSRLEVNAEGHRVWGRAWGKVEGEWRFYIKPAQRLTFAARAVMGKLWNPPGLTGYALGGASGLRGWPLFWLWGEKKSLFTGELRLAGPALFQGALVPGFVLFTDLGEMEGEVAWDVGLGLRLGFLKVFKFPTTRIDFAWPYAQGSPVISIGTNQAF